VEPTRGTLMGVPPGQAEGAPAVPIESTPPGRSDSVPPGPAEMAELIQGLGAHLDQLNPIINRLSSSLPPPPEAKEPGKAGTQPAELDRNTQQLLSEAIAQAVAAQLGRVRISTIPPDSAPRSSMRAVAHAGGWLGKWSVYVSGGVSLLGSLIAIWKPEYAAPLSQSVKLILALVQAWVGSVPPSPTEAPARDVPVLVAPAPASALGAAGAAP
jgi:hypothetical protein